MFVPVSSISICEFAGEERRILVLSRATTLTEKVCPGQRSWIEYELLFSTGYSYLKLFKHRDISFSQKYNQVFEMITHNTDLLESVINRNDNCDNLSKRRISD